MLSRAHALIPLVILLTMTGTALAQEGPISAQGTDPTWRATYWNNMTLSGQPALQRAEPELNYDWGTKSPGPGVNADQFSARWTRYIDVAPGTYRFTATSDDGIRVWVDGTMLINEWYDHPAMTTSGNISLGPGHHLVTVEFYENRGGAVAKVWWEPADVVIRNWRGEYFNNMGLSGAPSLVRDDAEINFDWGTGSPAPGTIGSDRFSVRWTRTLDLPAGQYRFAVTADDGVRLWVNGHPLIDAWRDQPATTYAGEIWVPAGGFPVRMEFYENAGYAVARLSWTPVGGGTGGEVVVDDGDPGFVKGGSPTAWHVQYEGYGGDLIWTKNNDRERPNYNWARWYPSLTSGSYEVFVFIPERYTTTARALYWVSHRDGFASRLVDQSANGGRWVSLGTFLFQGNRSDYVSLNDVTGEPYLSRLIGFDAVKWVPR